MPQPVCSGNGCSYDTKVIILAGLDPLARNAWSVEVRGAGVVIVMMTVVMMMIMMRMM